MAYKVLIVDDSEIIRAVIKKSLLMSGLDIGELLEAADGLSALEALRRERVDVILVDLNMPRMRGEEMIASVRNDEATATVPILVISSVRNQEVLDEMAKLKVNGYITKPFYPEKLRDALAPVLGNRGDA
jgi:two-component system, chemotaxis family, chemotaxis protein CheY